MRPAVLVSAVCAAVLSLGLAGCGSGGYSTEGSQGTGKQLFLDANCGACHTLAAAGTSGTVGPNLDDAFAQARDAGMTPATFTQVIRGQILFPITETSTGSPGMPGPDTTIPECSDVTGDAFCVTDQYQAANDIAVYVAAVAGTGVTPEPPAGGQTDGKSIFETAGCAGCHTLADAGSTGTVGPNLDQAKPSKELVVDRVTNGQGAMPSFKGSLDEAQIQAVADYVSSTAGK